MNIYRHEIKVNFITTVLWICAICGISVILMLFYPMLKKDLDEYLLFLDNFPPAAKALMGIVTENFTHPIGYYGFAITYPLLFGAIQAMNLGVGILSKEERERTADFLMTKPVTRDGILAAKLAASMTILAFTNVCYLAVAYFMVKGFSEGEFESGKFLLISASLFFSQMIFFSVGLAVSTVLKKVRAVLPVSLGIVFMFFAISAFAVTSEDDRLRFVTPFQYFKTEYIIEEGRYEPEYVVTGAAVVIAGLLISYILYRRKDIQAV